MFWKKPPPIDITRKYEKVWYVAFNRNFLYDEKRMYVSCKELAQLQYIKFGRQSITRKRDNLNWTKKKITSSMKNTFF